MQPENASNALIGHRHLRARLDIVATYLDQNLDDPTASTLHVLGRTYGHPHKYFYRTYSSGIWSGWIAVTPDIESNHIVLAIWKGRLNIFWVTFIVQHQPPQGKNSSDPGSDHVANLSFDELASGIAGVTPTLQVQVQLHWAEYFQGKWTNRISSDPNSTASVPVRDDFDPAGVYIHVSKELDSSGNEGAVRIHLDFPTGTRTVNRTGIVAMATTLSTRGLAGFVTPLLPLKVNLGGGYAFRVTSKNCAPDFGTQYWQAPPPDLYDNTGVNATFYDGSSKLSVTFETDIQNSGSSTPEPESILQSVGNFALLPPGNPVLPSPFLVSADAAADPAYIQAGALVSPFFFKDTGNPSATASSFGDELTFFVEPSLTETTIDEWQGWAIPPYIPTQVWSNPAIIKNIPVISQVPVAGPVPIDTGDPAYSLYPMQDSTDWLTDPATVVFYGTSVIGQSGGLDLAAVNAASGVASVGSVSTLGTLARSTGLNVVGSSGINLTVCRPLKLRQAFSAAAGPVTKK